MKLTSEIFRILVAASLFFTLTCIISEFTTKAFLPAPLRSYLDEKRKTQLDPTESLVVMKVLPVLLANLISYVGLFQLRKWGRFLFFLTNLGLLLFTPFIGPSVSTAFTETLSGFAGITTGAVIALSYFGPLFDDPAPPPLR